MKLDKKQEEIVNTNYEKVVVTAGAGSGKTRLLTERVKELLRRGAEPSKVVVITFTNSAAEEMRERIGEHGKDCFIGTIHSYCNFLLVLGGVDTADYLDKEMFDELFNLIENHQECIQTVDYLLLDEAQDSTPQQFKFMLEYINPKSFFIVGDIKQSIYGFAGADPDYLYNLSKRKDVHSYELTNDYRNAFAILQYAKGILSSLSEKFADHSISLNDEYGEVYRFPYSIDRIYNIIENSYDQYKDWFILTRSNEQLQTIFYELQQRDIPCETFRKAEMKLSELKERMNNDTVKILTIHTAKGLEAKNVIVVGSVWYNDEEKRTNYVAATRAKERLYWCLTPKKQSVKKNRNLEVWR